MKKNTMGKGIKLFYFLFLFVIALACTDERTDLQIMTDLEHKTDSGDFIDAKKDIEILSDRSFESSQFFYLTGVVEKNLNKKKEALISFQKAINIDSSNYMALVERAKLKVELGDFNGAIQDCNQALSLQKEDGEIYKTLAVAYENLGDISSAITKYELAISFGDDDGDTYYDLGKLLLNANKKEKACMFLRKAGELGLMDAFDLIKSNCNQLEDSNGKEVSNDEKSGQFRSYPRRYSITFPKDWEVDEISNLDKSVLSVSAHKEGHFMSVIEVDPTIIDLDFKAKSVIEIDKEFFIYEHRQKYDDFKLLFFEKTKINNIDAYYYKMSFSFFSNSLNKRLSGITCQYILLNPRNHKIYSLQANAEDDDIDIYEPIYKKTFQTFKFQ